MGASSYNAYLKWFCVNVKGEDPEDPREAPKEQPKVPAKNNTKRRALEPNAGPVTRKRAPLTKFS